VPELSPGTPADPSPAFAAYAHPRRLVSTEWLSANIGNPQVKVIECNQDPMLYAIGHIPGAHRLDWRGEVNDPQVRDVVAGARFATLMRERGIARDDTIVLYGDQANCWAAYAAWVLTLFGHADVRLLDGGRDAWQHEGRETTLEPPWLLGAAGYPETGRDDRTVRVFADELRSAIGSLTLFDVRSPAEYAGDSDADGRHADRALRGGHIPGARNVPWRGALTADGRFRPAAQLRAIYTDVDPDAEVVLYCRTGEQSAHTWFVLTYLLGYPHVRVYDGSWAEWGNTIGTPIAKGQ
jgi:thiosulfate/3-mercaptopyruvate sulfurtransferase